MVITIEGGGTVRGSEGEAWELSRANCTSRLAGVVTLLSEGVMLPTLDNVGCITSLSEGVMLSTLDIVAWLSQRLKCANISYVAHLLHH